MTKSLLSILTQLLWLGLSFIMTAIIYKIGLGQDFSDLFLHRSDTYLIFTPAAVIIPLFLLLTFTLYFIKESRKRFSRTLPNIILLAIGLLFLILLTLASKEFIKLGINCGWTAYPQFPGLPDVPSGSVTLNPFVSTVTNVMALLQVMITVALLYAVFQWGRRTQQS